MNILVKNVLIILLVTLSLLMISCSEEPDAVTPVEEVSTSSVIGSVSQFEEGKSLFIETEDDLLTLDVKDATVHQDITTGMNVEAITTGEEAHLVLPANELNPYNEEHGYVFAVNEGSFDLLVNKSIQTFASNNADILFADFLTVGMFVNVTIREDGSASVVEVIDLNGGRVLGEVTQLNEELIAISTFNEITFAFSVQNFPLPNDLAVGDYIAIDYHGTLNGDKQAVNVIVNPSSPTTEGLIEGIVTDIVNHVITINSADGDVVSLAYASDNTFTSDRLVIGDGVSVEYSSTEDGVIFADNITPTKYSDLATTELSGYITRYDAGLISIRTNEGNSYSFSHNAATGIYSELDLKLGDKVRVRLTKNENDFWHCTELFANEYQPATETETGNVIEILDGKITIITSEGYDLSYYYYGAILNSPLPIMRNDNITIEYYPLESGLSNALTVTFNSTEDPFVPQELEDIVGSGVVVGNVLLDDDLLYVKSDDLVIHAFETENTVFADEPKQGDRVNVQYLGSPSTSMVAAVITFAEQE